MAAGLTGAYAETIPNFEVLTLVVFCSGVLLGVRDGMLTGAPRAAVMATAAVVLTLFFDLVTNLATGYLLGQVRIALLGGIPFSLWHIGWNVVLFVGVGTPLVGALSHYRSRLSH